MYEKELRTLRKAVKESGKVLTKLFGKTIQITKKGEIDLVTEADLASEKVIIETIRNCFPDDKIITEEAGDDNSTSDRIWIIDPLDGTTNFAHGFPFFAVSIALQVKTKIVLGAVFNPYMDEYFEAVKGNGATLNKRSIKTSDIKELRDALLGTGFPYSIYKDSKKPLELFQKLVVKAQGIRRPGAAAMDLCYVAAGRMDGFWEQGLKPWDTAAGSLILIEAGGKISDYQGEPYSPYHNTIIATNPYIFESMLKLIKE